MTAFVALLRAVNVGGRKLLMTDLRRIAEELGFGEPSTYIASGNLLFTSGKSEAVLRSALEERLTEHLGARVGVVIRDAAELANVAAANPFPEAPGNSVVAIFLDEPPRPEAIEEARNVGDERLALGGREIYVHYPSGMGRSKLKIPAAAAGTARNMNTVAKLAEMAEEKA